MGPCLLLVLNSMIGPFYRDDEAVGLFKTLRVTGKEWTGRFSVAHLTILLIEVGIYPTQLIQNVTLLTTLD